jgi:hypothetical protein
LSKKGSFDGETLVLGDTRIPVAAIGVVDYRSRYMILSVMTGQAQPATLAFSLTSGSPEKLKQALGRARSAAWAQLHKKDLEEKGLGHTYREVQCPHCQAIIDLTGQEPTPQVSCEFCHAIATVGDDLTGDAAGRPRHGERHYRICDECGMYSRPRQFTIFYFYFLLVVYGFHTKSTWRCPACMRPEAWKMLFGNLLFVLGVPVALVQLFRSYGGSDLGGLYSGLDGANLKARRGNLQGAIDGYKTILEKQPIAAGLKYNIGLAFLHKNETAEAAKMFEICLADCANYRPAVAALARCYQALGETDKLAELKRQWSSDKDDAAKEA